MAHKLLEIIFIRCSLCDFNWQTEKQSNKEQVIKIGLFLRLKTGTRKRPVIDQEDTTQRQGGRDVFLSRLGAKLTVLKWHSGENKVCFHKGILIRLRMATPGF